MDQLKRLLDTLGWKQAAVISIAAGGVLFGLVTFSHWNRERDFRPLYSELSQEDASAVLAKVRESGAEFRLSENGSAVLVPSARVAELRLELAAAGVPKSGRIGFELFDKANFGASDFTEQVNYHRALEGELERSVMALAEVEQARVHITLAKDSVYLDSKQPAKASVLVKLRAGAQLSAQNVAAICQLTASAVEGLAPEAVSVVDMHGNLLSRARKAPSADDNEPSEAALDYRQKVEHDLLAKIESTLTPLLGEDKFRATASVECDFSSAEQSDETFDPSKTVMLTSQKTEDISGGAAVAAGVPGTASNLPKPPARPAGSSGGVTRRTENITYQSSHSVRHVRTPQGIVKRLSVALLVDSDVRWDGSGPKAKRIVETPSPEKLKTIHDLVAGVIGFNAERGDQLVIETLPFESTLNPETLPAGSARPAPAPASPADQFMKSKYLPIAGGVAAIVVLGLVFLVIKLSRRQGGRAAAQVEMKPQLSSAGGEDFNQKVQNQIAEQTALRQQQEMEALNALKLPVATKKTEVLTKHIGEQAKKDSTAMAHVLRSWMSEGKPQG